MDTDFLLIRRMKNGDEKAFDTFIRKYYKAILNYCNYHCFDVSYAEDITQDTFVRFFESLPGYHHTGKALNYLYTIARNLCLDDIKKSRDCSLEDVQKQIEDKPEGLKFDSFLQKMMVDDALKSLSAELQEVIILYYFQGLKLSEIADILQIGLPLVKYRIRKAKLQLKDLLKED